jgi:hypothetical protein
MKYIFTQIFIIFLGTTTPLCSDAAPPTRLDQEGTIGIWYDKTGPANLTIKFEGGEYILYRINSDKSKGVYKLRRAGDDFHTDDRFGHIYRITGNSLNIFDANGYIRTLNKNPLSP